VGRKNSKSSIGSHGHPGDTRSGQTRKTPKNLGEHDREDRPCGEGVGLYVVYIREGGEGGRGDPGTVSEASSLLSYKLRYASLTELVNVCQVGFREPIHLCTCVSEEGGDG